MAATEDKEKLMGLPFSVQIPLRIDGFRASILQPTPALPPRRRCGSDERELDIIEHATGEKLQPTSCGNHFLGERTARISRCAVHLTERGFRPWRSEKIGWCANDSHFNRHAGGRA